MLGPYVKEGNVIPNLQVCTAFLLVLLMTWSLILVQN